MEPRQPTERRQSTRFPIERRLYYRTLNRRGQILAGNGKTLNISSTGILFTADHKLPVGTSLEMNIEWPTELNAKELSTLLVVRGRVTREQDKGVFAVQIKGYKLRPVAS
jgi:PilZ domain